ncbi:oligopeptide ABC transporter substrate-binding protein [Sediminibacillus terrae]|uniref:oligopeptide ABC transporter substrate-binding protein n=1 Tax=Sediminibacillus terrae TaxID=1562106 RepID=UPI0012967AD2|nr:oligopeptide ABC transporter substrate-binding protein [Sediminibacillus terrae]
MSKRYLGKLFSLLTLVLMFFILTACNDEDAEAEVEGNDNADKGEAAQDDVFSIDDFEQIKTNQGEAIEGGTLNFGLVSDTAFEGTLNFNFYSGNPDAQVISWFDESLLDVDENYAYTNDGAATLDVDREAKTITFKIRDNVNWHDGEPVTAEDWQFAYEVIGHPDYDGIRYGSDFTIIKGMEAYHSGEADAISGIEVIDEKTMKISYDTFTPSLLSSGIWSYAMPKHIFKDIPVADMSSSPEVREKPIGMGPFKVDSIVPGESVTFVKNENYWRGEPNLDGVTLKVINPNVVVQALENGEVDLVDSFPTDQYPENADMSNVEFVGDVDLAYTYIGFKLGKWDAEAGEVIPDPEAKMADVDLRRAMWHAVDNDTVGKKFYNGLRWNANTLIPPSHPDYHDDSIEAPTYDPDKANQLLDDAGYEDVNGDGIREDKDGNELVINFASMSGGDTAEPLAQYYIQAWEAVGLKVELLDGRLQEFNTFYDRVEADDPEIDIYQGAWSVGYDVNPAGLYGRDAAFNYTRYASEENDALLQEGVSEKAFDEAYRQDVYSKWQELMVDEIPVFPTVYRAVIIPVNNRVQNYAVDFKDGVGIYRYQLALTQEEAVTAE